MGLYSKYILPKVIDWTCKQKPSRKQREKIVPVAYGNVLEIGIGSGLNLPFYNHENIKSILGIDPSKEIWSENQINVNNFPFEFQFVQARAENIPADNNSFDSVLVTYSLCTIPELAVAFDEIRRVMKDNGKLIFCEHGKAPDKAIERWQNVLNPIWKQFSGGCNLNRDIPSIIRNNGFKIDQMETMYIPGWKPVTFNYWGTASIQ